MIFPEIRKQYKDVDVKILKGDTLSMVSGGMNLDGLPQSQNVLDQRGTNMGTYIDANSSCWAPGTSSAVMYPHGGGTAFNPHDPDTVTNAAGASDFAKCFLSGGKHCS
ncbi:hypothetical protein AB2Y09_004213 [Salmonella enterica]